MFNSDIYKYWRKRRFDTIINHYGRDFFKGKTLLEIGAGYGDLGKMFYDLGCDVTCYEGRTQNLNMLKSTYPELKSMQFNCDTDTIEDYFNIILHTGVLYHMGDIDDHLKNCLEKCDHLILETEVQDKSEPDIIFLEEATDCQAAGLTIRVSRPSPAYIENILKSCGSKISLPANPSYLNMHPWIYDWEIENTGLVSTFGYRRMWFVEIPPDNKLNYEI